MIVKIRPSGTSFKGGINYLTHDKGAQTAERVAWTHTKNLVNDHIPAAVNEMLWTYRDAELLKQEAGIRAGGRKSEHPVKHIILSWDPRDNPTDLHMRETAEHYLKYMGWHEHQAIVVAHNDMPYKHLHIILNEVHPVTGRVLNDGYEHNRAQKWADAYERENGLRCPQRELHPDHRQPSMPRNIRMAFKNSEMEFELSEEQLRSSELAGEYVKGGEWKVFKNLQRAEREQFFADGKVAFKQLRNAVYQEVHAEFKERWSDYYKADKKTVGDERKFLKAVKAELVADEKAALEPRRDEACKQLREKRDGEYQELLGHQREVRAQFRDHLASGQDSTDFFHEMVDGAAAKRTKYQEFRAASHDATSRSSLEPRPVRENEGMPAREDADVGGGRDRDIGNFGARRVVASVGSFLDALFFDLTTLGSNPRTLEAEPDNAFAMEVEEATKRLQHDQQLQYDEEWRQRSKQSYGE